MKHSETAKLCLTHHKSHSKETLISAYDLILTKLLEEFGGENLEEILSEKDMQILSY